MDRKCGFKSAFRGLYLCDVRIALQFGIIKPLHVNWFFKLCTYMQKEQNSY